MKLGRRPRRTGCRLLQQLLLLLLRMLFACRGRCLNRTVAVAIVHDQFRRRVLDDGHFASAAAATYATAATTTATAAAAATPGATSTATAAITTVCRYQCWMDCIYGDLFSDRQGIARFPLIARFAPTLRWSSA
uniref:Putative secreted protein n=1 Tax=Anopheles marajoara TaxID=58244 RepID=A0A2M4C6S7_9DIPT